MHIQHSISNLIAPRVPPSFTSSPLPGRNPYVPARVCATSGSTTRYLIVVEAVRQRPGKKSILYLTYFRLIIGDEIGQLYAKVDNIINVSRNDFRPPPQVESSVIRLVPIDPPPPVKFEEFDGMNRIIFSRPNKTVRGNFQAKGVMKMLEQNRSTWLAVQEMV